MRMTPLSKGERDQEQTALLDRLRAFRGRDLNVFATVARHPDLLRAWARFGGVLMNRGALPARDRELLILRTAHRCRVPYEWEHHVELATEVGVRPDDLRAAAGEVEPADPWDATLFAAADELSVVRELSEPTWASLARRYDERQLLEVCFVVGQYALIAGVVRSLGIENDPPLEVGP
jgi:alkylhydroperoxidase family enzyme